MTSSAAIDVRAISKRFGNYTAVDAITFDVLEGEVFGLLGPNGAGKSTLIRMLTTLLVPTSGGASVGGCDVQRDPAGVRGVIGVIPQNMTSDLDLSVWENLLIFAKLYGVPRRARNALLAELIEAVDLTAWTHKPVKMLSGGMRRRVEIARGLVHRPRILFLDEPTTGLDPVSRTAVWEMLHRIRQSRNLTVLLTTHYLEEADRLCDRVAIVDHGRLMALDTPLRLKASVPGKSVIDASFDHPPATWPARLRALPGAEWVSGDGPAFRIATSDGPLTLKALIEAGELDGLSLLSVAVQSTTLDDVFVQYTGHQLHGSSQDPAGTAAHSASSSTHS